MKKALLCLLLLILGAGAISYPFISNYLTEKNGSYVIDSYSEDVAKASEQELKDAWDEAVKYNENLSGSPAHDPFIEGSGMVMQDNYMEVLALDDVMGYIEIPKIGVKLPIYHGTSDEVLHKGIGHLEGSSLPVGGPDTHTVLTGHSGLSSAKLFTDIRELEVGDLFYIHVLGETLAYEVDRIKVVEPNRTEELDRVIGEDMATLLTCTPYGINSHRLLVRGSRTEYVPEVAESIEQRTGLSQSDRILLITAGASAGAVIVMIIIALVVKRRINKKRRRIEILKGEILK